MGRMNPFWSSKIKKNIGFLLYLYAFRALVITFIICLISATTTESNAVVEKASLMTVIGMVSLLLNIF